jgi:hypothetical protein
LLGALALLAACSDGEEDAASRGTNSQGGTVGLEGSTGGTDTTAGTAGTDGVDVGGAGGMSAGGAAGQPTLYLVGDSTVAAFNDAYY